ncbi:MAG: tRNA pseudouridine(54/55) synthase Pus10 [Candidatus Hodarchaeales archaeon]
MDFINDKLIPAASGNFICVNCLGRQFGKLLTGLTNKERGEAIRIVLGMYLSWLRKNSNDQIANTDFLTVEAEILKNFVLGGFTPALKELELREIVQPDKQDCWLCGGILSGNFIQETVKLAVKQINDMKLEFKTFLVGSSIPGSVAEREEEFKARLGLAQGEALKSELNRETGKALMKTAEFKDKEVEFATPEVVFIIDVENSDVEIKINPLFIYGRYRKLQRGIPQSTWHCSNCRGDGCEECNHTGRKYPTSVEEIVANPAIRLSRANAAKFHGSGREDIDALMLGRGRPFVLELVEPKSRYIDLNELEKAINVSTGVNVDIVGFANREIVRRIKLHDPGITKKYRALVQLESPLDDQKIAGIIEMLTSNEIKQQTPQRVKHRRADLVRKRKVLSMTAERVTGDELKLKVSIHCQGGLYVKELISGDEGRTIPSFSELAGTKAVIIELDVVDVDERFDLNKIRKKEVQ